MSCLGRFNSGRENLSSCVFRARKPNDFGCTRATPGSRPASCVGSSGLSLCSAFVSQKGDLDIVFASRDDRDAVFAALIADVERRDLPRRRKVKSTHSAHRELL